MQKVIRRTLFAEKQAARRLARRKEITARELAKSRREQNLYARRDETSQIKAARAARKEDWELGPLAPRRDVGTSMKTYGTVGAQRIQRPQLDDGQRDEMLKSVGGRYLNITKGDRVVLLEGRDKGKIGKIKLIDQSTASCMVEGLNMVNYPRLFVIPRADMSLLD
jgi:large subunit ribosomal protein L24